VVRARDGKSEKDMVQHDAWDDTESSGLIGKDADYRTKQRR